MSKRGKFIAIEGIGGAGKTVLVEGLQRLLTGRSVYFTEEPGGTKIGRKLRPYAKGACSPTRTPFEQILLFFFLRSIHARTVIKPCLEKGETVICDRYSASTFAYQIFAGEKSEQVRQLSYNLLDMIQHGCEPDLWILLTCDPEVALRRAQGRKDDYDAFDKRDLRFQEVVQRGFEFYLLYRPTLMIDTTDSLPDDLARFVYQDIVRRNLV